MKVKSLNVWLAQWQIFDRLLGPGGRPGLYDRNYHKRTSLSTFSALSPTTSLSVLFRVIPVQ